MPPVVLLHHVFAVEHLVADFTGIELLAVLLLVLGEVAVGGEESRADVTLERLVVWVEGTKIEQECDQKQTAAKLRQKEKEKGTNLPVRQLWNFKAFSRRKDFSHVLHLYLYSWSGCRGHRNTMTLTTGAADTPEAAIPTVTYHVLAVLV